LFLKSAPGEAAFFFAARTLRILRRHIISKLMLSVAQKPQAQKPQVSRARELGFALHDVARLLRTYSDQRARELGTTRAQWAVLSRLQRCEGVKQNELAEALDLAPITLGRLIDKLTAADLVERRDDAADRRANRLYLTEKAAPALKDLNALAEDLMGRALAGVDEFAIRAMQDGLATIKANLKHELTGGAESK
jgi:MarR family transcriptional regulator, transcriptional regulator for hemolysin